MNTQSQSPIPPNDNNKKANAKRVFNTVSLGTLYFGGAVSLWSSNQVSNGRVVAMAIIFSIVTLSFLAAVFCEHVLTFLSSKWIATILVAVSPVVFLFTFMLGFLQPMLQAPSLPLQSLAYLGFAWSIVLLLIMIRDAYPKNHKKFHIWYYVVSYAIVVFLFIFAGFKLSNRDVWRADFWKSVNFWSGIYLIIIAVLILSVAMRWLRVRGEIYERPE
jgi:hypothetical protein